MSRSPEAAGAAWAARLPRAGAQRLVEPPDVATSSPDYARRFAGAVGAWFLAIQARATLDLLRALPPPATVLDVGAGHAQITPSLIAAGYRVVALGSTPACARRLRPWIDGGACRFVAAPLERLPFPDRAFDAVVCFRLLAHAPDWRGLVGELCRVARREVVADYASRRSVNRAADRLFALKRRWEKDTRPFLLFRPREVRAAFAGRGFVVNAARPQFLLPMALHRSAGSARAAAALEAPWRVLGLTRLFGSPVIVRARRRPDSTGPLRPRGGTEARS